MYNWPENGTSTLIMMSQFHRTRLLFIGFFMQRVQLNLQLIAIKGADLYFSTYWLNCGQYLLREARYI